MPPAAARSRRFDPQPFEHVSVALLESKPQEESLDAAPVAPVAFPMVLDFGDDTAEDPQVGRQAQPSGYSGRRIQDKAVVFAEDRGRRRMNWLAPNRFLNELRKSRQGC